MRGNIISINDYVGHYEVPLGESMTVPDQTLSLREILRNVVEGRGTGLTRILPLEYDPEDDDDFGDPTLEPGFDKLDANLISSQLKSRAYFESPTFGDSSESPFSAVERGLTPLPGSSCCPSEMPSESSGLYSS